MGDFKSHTSVHVTSIIAGNGISSVSIIKEIEYSACLMPGFCFHKKLILGCRERCLNGVYLLLLEISMSEPIFPILMSYM
jgi:hypothetical protein